ncbi:MAG: hypothetical protein AAF840_10000 [Bacteroidota bacterium]
MPRILTLLLLSLLCTCALAQNPSPPLGSGSIIVEIDEGSWFVTISSADTNETHGFDTQTKYRQSPRTYVGYQTIKDQDRHQMDHVHRLINQKIAAGWQLLSVTPVQLSVPVGFEEVAFTETIYYNFLLPIKPTKAQPDEKLTEVKSSGVWQNNRQHMVANLMKKSNGNHVLIIQEKIGDRWLENFRLENEGIVAGDLPERIKALRLSKEGITFELDLAIGSYSYTFSQAKTTPGYFLSQITFTSNEDCGLNKYQLRTPTGNLSNFIARYVEEPCTPGDKGKQISEFVIIPRRNLKDFVPGAYKIDLKRSSETPIY